MKMMIQNSSIYYNERLDITGLLVKIFEHNGAGLLYFDDSTSGLRVLTDEWEYIGELV